MDALSAVITTLPKDVKGVCVIVCVCERTFFRNDVISSGIKVSS
jgi:hypothetical protein